MTFNAGAITEEIVKMIRRVGGKTYFKEFMAAFSTIERPSEVARSCFSQRSHD
jgi:hypothetical protein